MEGLKKIKSALISVFDKTDLQPLIDLLHQNQVTIYSTGGTYEFIIKMGIPATKVEDLTGYPSILGGRVKTLHPKVFGGILARRQDTDDAKQMQDFEIPEIDLVLVDLYPFEKTLATTNDQSAIIEKIDIGGISLIRAAAKNFEDVLVVASVDFYDEVIDLLKTHNASSSLAQRKLFAARAFAVSSHYDTAIFNYFNNDKIIPAFKQSEHRHQTLRYGENPHQKGWFFGNLSERFVQLHGKEISYNNLLDLDAGVQIISDFAEPTVAILKHNNACGLASREHLLTAWKDALAGDPVSAFGGVIVCNQAINGQTAKEINKLFFEIILAPGYDEAAMGILKSKKNRIILRANSSQAPDYVFRSALNGALVQQRDSKKESPADLDFVTYKKSNADEIEDLLFANIIVKHSKSNAIVLVKNKQLIASGVGQTSRVDALRHAIAKAEAFGFNLEGSVLASDAFFPFADSVEIAHKAGITAIVQPGGSIRDKDSIDYCNNNSLAMAFSGVRHFKH